MECIKYIKLNIHNYNSSKNKKKQLQRLLVAKGAQFTKPIKIKKNLKANLRKQLIS